MEPPEIAHFDKEEPDAYHGTFKISAYIIQKNGFSIGRSGKLFLGDGVYFFRGSFETAYEYAKKYRSKNNGIDIAVIKALVRMGKCLDVDNPAHYEFIRDCRDKARARLGRLASDRLDDAVVFNLVAELTGIETLTATRTSASKKRIFEESKWLEKEIIICVRNLKNILSVEIIES